MQRAFAKRHIFTDGRAGESNPNGSYEDPSTFNQAPPEPPILPTPTPEPPVPPPYVQPKILKNVTYGPPTNRNLHNSYRVLLNRYFTLKQEIADIHHKLSSVGIDPDTIWNK